MTACCLAPQDSAENTRNRLYLLPYCALLRRQSDIPRRLQVQFFPNFPEPGPSGGKRLRRLRLCMYRLAREFEEDGVIQAISAAAATAMRRLSAMALGMAGPSGELAAIPPK